MKSPVMISLQLAPSEPPRPWIPPASLIAGQVAHGLSWLLLMLTAWPSTPGLSMPALAWIHTVALGWLTMTALGVLVHVIPGFMDVEWRLEGMARWSLLPYGIGVASLVAGFALVQPWLLATGGTLIVLGLTGYMIPAVLTILSFKATPTLKTPFKTGFLSVLGSLAIAAVLGVTMAWALAGAPWPAALIHLPPIHAILAGGGWLSLLIFGVSTRTIFPVTGRRRTKLPLHVFVSSGFTIGAVLMVLGLIPGLAHPALRWLGMGLVAIAAACYVIDMGKLVYHAPNDHKPPIAYVASTLVYLVATVVLGLGVTGGRAEWQAPLAFVALVGWMGLSVNGYLHHIGIRLLTTMARGEDDETPPQELLNPRLSWLGFAGQQVAVLGGTLVLLAGAAQWLPLFGTFGLLGWLAMMLNIRSAWVRATAA
ncbi:MAG TPA: hypothetical protein V6D05_01590 [Stenomitos sp.]